LSNTESRRKISALSQSCVVFDEPFAHLFLPGHAPRTGAPEKNSPAEPGYFFSWLASRLLLLSSIPGLPASSGMQNEISHGCGTAMELDSGTWDDRRVWQLLVAAGPCRVAGSSLVTFFLGQARLAANLLAGGSGPPRFDPAFCTSTQLASIRLIANERKLRALERPLIAEAR